MNHATQFIAIGDALYLCDNDACYCGEHLGSSAKHTGHDISGRAIMRITPRFIDHARKTYGYTPRCEQCGKTLKGTDND